MTDNKKGIILNIISVMIMAFSTVLNKFSVSTLHPFQASFLNALISFIITLLTLVFSKTKIPFIKNQVIWILGITNTLGIVLQYFSISLLDTVTTGLIGRFYIVFAILLSIFVLKEKLNNKDILPLILVVLGTFMVSNFGNDFSSSIGIICALSYTFFFALTNTLAKKMVKDTNENIILLYNQAISAIILFVIICTTGNYYIEFNYGFASVAMSAFLSGYLGLLFFYKGLKYISFREANVIRSLNPIFVFIYSLPFFKVNININFMIGAALIIGSILWMNYNK